MRSLQAITTRRSKFANYTQMTAEPGRLPFKKHQLNRPKESVEGSPNPGGTLGIEPGQFLTTPKGLDKMLAILYSEG